MSPEIYREMAQLESSHWWFLARRAILRAVLHTLPLPIMPTILEVGCGTGGNLEMLTEFGAVTGMEMDDFARHHAQSRSGCTVLSGHLPHNIPDLPTYDLVCLFDVLEHIQEDALALQSLHRLVNPSGHIFLTVPAYQWLWGPHDVAHRHHRRYNLSHLRTLTIETGWRIRRISHFNTFLMPLVILRRLQQRLSTESEPQSDAKLPKAWINSLLTHVFSSEALWIRFHSLPCGVSILAILERT